MAAPPDVHDLLVIPSNNQLYRLKATSQENGYAPTVPPVGYQDTAYRKVMNIAQLGPGDAPRGPAFAVLPNKPDPSTSQICCYLINSQNLRAANPWTAEPWNSEPGDDASNAEAQLEANRFDGADLDLLVAMADGRVLRVQEKHPIAALDLKEEGEVYTQLRNGLVAGTVYCKGADKVLPIVNITSLFPR